MVIEQINEKKLLIVLEEKDMGELGLEYENISWKNEKSRDVIGKLLTLAEKETGFSINNYKLSIETLPQYKGCIIIFTLGEKKQKNDFVFEDVKYKKNKKGSNFTLYRFFNIDHVLDICKKIYNLCKSNTYKSDIYTYKNDYYLILHSYDSIDKNVCVLLEEYGEKINQNRMIMAYIRECGYSIKNDDAIVKIARNM